MRNQANCPNSCVVLAIIMKFNQKLLFHFLSLQAPGAVSMHIPYRTLFHVQVHEILASISMVFVSPVATHSLRSKTALPLFFSTLSVTFLLPLFPQKSLLQPLPVLPSFVPLSSRRVRVSLFDSDCALTPKRRETQKEFERVSDAVLFFFSVGRATAPFFFSLSPSFSFFFVVCVLSSSALAVLVNVVYCAHGTARPMTSQEGHSNGSDTQTARRGEDEFEVALHYEKGEVGCTRPQ